MHRKPDGETTTTLVMEPCVRQPLLPTDVVLRCQAEPLRPAKAVDVV